MIEKKTDTRAALLAAAEKLFAERGYNSVSTRDLAEAAGANLAAIQYHFGSKAKLFVEVVHSIMEATGCAQARLAADAPTSDRSEAALRVARFISGFLDYLLAPLGPQPCRMMVREVFTDHSQDPEMIEALIASVVEKYMRPSEAALKSSLKVLCPDAQDDQLALIARSINGQCTFYASHRPFLERFSGPECYSNEGRRALSRHVITFSLLGIGCERALIDLTLSRLQEEWKECAQRVSV